MPDYDYRCEKGHTFEVSQPMADDALDTCEQCGAPAERVLHSPNSPAQRLSLRGMNYSTRPRQGGGPPPDPVEKDEGGS